MLKTILLSGFIVLGGVLTVQAPTGHYEPVKSAPIKKRILRVRITAYSPKEPRESKIGMRNNRITNEKGCAVSRDLLKIIPYGSKIRLEDGSIKIVDDTTNRRLKKTVDIRYYGSLNKNKSIKKQLQKLDGGWGEIEILGH